MLFDLRFAIRTCAKNLGNSLAVVVVLALGIGIAASLFGMADPFLTRRLPYRDAGRLVVVELTSD